MTAEELKEFLKKRDRIISVLAKDGKFRASIIKNTFSAQTAQQKHNLRGVPSYLLARQLAAASMMAIFLKGEERVILEADGSGPIQKVFAEASQVGEVRGFVAYDPKQLADFDAEKISRPPRPACPSEEKNKVPSFRMKGNISSESVFTIGPRFSGLLQLSPSRLHIQMSFPPEPPGISEEKNNCCPSNESAG